MRRMSSGLLPAILLTLLSLSLPSGPASAEAQQPTVHAVLFYSPTCPHCHKVMTEDLPPLVKKYGERLSIATVDITDPVGQSLYRATVDYFGLTSPRIGVPTLVVGSDVLVGDMEIPARFPGLIEDGLSSGGVPWPAVPAIRRALAQAGVSQPDTATSAATADSLETRPDSVAEAGPTRRPVAVDSSVASLPPAATDTSSGAISTTLPVEPPRPGPLEAFSLDPVGNGAAVVVLLGLLAAVFISVRAVVQGPPPSRPLPSWIFPTLAAVGMGVASYLAFVEVTGHEAVCGPVGHCNVVQQSPYAYLFGAVPVGMLGQIGYLILFAMWTGVELGPPGFRPLLRRLLWGTALVGTLFSVYLTVLEPFVIGATCAWCLTSSIVMALMLLVATVPTHSKAEA